MQHANRMVKTTEQSRQKNQSELPLGRHQTFLKTLSRSHNFVTFIVFLLCFVYFIIIIFCFKSMKVCVCVSVQVARALFSWTKDLKVPMK